MTMSKNNKILVIGGGISGITAALEAAEVGYEVVLVEKEPYLGGRVARMYRYFPKMCPPTCGLEINFRRIRNNSRVQVYTNAEVTQITGEAGNFEAKISIAPRYVKSEARIPESVVEKLSSEVSNDFNYGLDKVKALNYPHPMAFPMQHVLYKDALSAEDRETLEKEVPSGMIDFDMSPEEVTVQAGAVIVATGWQPYDAEKIENLGYGQYDNLITNVMMERLAAYSGPTKGAIQRISDDKEIKKVAFVQCAGSRDENHLPYCSGICCMGSLKQARYIREKLPDAEVTIYYIDIRTISRHEKFYYDLLNDDLIKFVKGKVAKITEDSSSKDLLVEAENTLTGQKSRDQFDLAVLATGMVPNTAETKIPVDGIEYDQYGFILPSNGKTKGIYATGCVLRPIDVARSVRQATGAAIKAIQSCKEE